MKQLMMISALALASTTLMTGCETISEEACLAGNWEDIGFRDGEQGRSRSRLVKIAETCGEVGQPGPERLYSRA